MKSGQMYRVYKFFISSLLQNTVKILLKVPTLERSYKTYNFNKNIYFIHFHISNVVDLNLRHLNRQIYNTFPEVKENNIAFHENDSATAKTFNSCGI